MSDASQQEEQPKRRGGGRGEVQLGRHVRIDATRQIPALSTNTAEAYPASDSRQPGTALYALVFTEANPAREEVVPLLSRIEGQPVVTPVDWGVVPWDGRGGQRFVAVQRQPTGELLATDSDRRLPALREDQLVDRLVKPMTRALREMFDRSVTHRAICAQNVYTGDPATQEMILGECISRPAGTVQPPVYETVQGAQANPIGRGPGDPRDDLYALGVLMAILLRGGNPMDGWSPHDIVMQKMAVGTYSALMGRTRASLKLMEPMRGLLTDDEEDRWDIDDLEMWLNGRQLSPKQAALPNKARRAFRFNGQEYWSAPALAHALANDWRNAIAVMGSGEIQEWAERSLGDEKHANRIHQVIAKSGGQSDDRALAQLLIALDPRAPIRFRSMAVRVEAIPQALALALEREGERELLSEIILAKMPQRWMEQQVDRSLNTARLVSASERLNSYLGQSDPGYGIERCIYDFNAGWPCLSPLVLGQYVNEIERLLPALEKRAEAGAPDTEPIDRHIAAYCIAWMDSQTIERIATSTSRRQPDLMRKRALLHLLARLQKRNGPRKLPALTTWAGRFASDIVAGYHNRKTREKADQRVQRAVDNASLIELVNAADDPETRRRDASGFQSAQHEYEQIKQEIAWLEDGGLTSDANVARATRNVATAVSALMSGLGLVLMTVAFVA